MSERFRILFLTESYWPVLGGGETHIRGLGSSLAKRGHKISVITRRTQPAWPEREQESGIDVRRVGPHGISRTKKFTFIPAIWSAAREAVADCDIVVVRGTRVLALPGLQVARASRKPCVLQPELNGELDGSLAFWGRKAGRLALGTAFTAARARNALLRSAVVVAMSRAICDEAKRGGFSPARIVRIPHGVDPVRFSPATPDVRAQLRGALMPGIPADAIVAIYTGRLLRGKGLEVALDAVETLRVANVHFVLVGAGDGQTLSIEGALRARVAASETLRTRVTFFGRTDDVASCLRAADLFVFPTLDESFGISLLEAQACGLPAIASRTGGVPDILQDGETGMLVPVGDVASLKAAIERLAGDQKTRHEMAVAARSRVLEFFDFEKTVDRYEALFDRLAHGLTAA